MSWTARFVTCVFLASLVGCVSGPDYAGGPTSEQPHGIVDPDRDISIWRVDGFDTLSRNSAILLEPGLRRVKIRIEFPIDSEAAQPFEYRELNLRVEANHLYELSRKEIESEYDLGPPYEVEIRDYVMR
jgi:hypothetical protein